MPFRTPAALKRNLALINARPRKVLNFHSAEAAALLKTTRQQIRKMIQSGELPAVKVGREWRIPAESLDTFPWA